jgi:tetratricopeptide (TPR) repeat protein
MNPGAAAERLTDATRVVRLAAETGDQERELQARKARLFDLLELGDAASADVEIERIDELARALRQPRYLADAATIRAMRTLMDGRLDEGGELAERALTLNQRVRPEIATMLYGGQMYRTVWREKGQLAELERGMNAILAILDEELPKPSARSAFAFVRSEQGKREEARAEFESVAGELASIPREMAWTAVMANLSEVCCFLADSSRARALYAELLPFAAMNVVLGPVPYACLGPIAHYLGMLAATMGETRKAEEHFVHALEMEAHMRMPAMRVRTQYECGRMLVQSDRPDDAKRGAGLLAAGWETAKALGMDALEARIRVLLPEPLPQTVRASEMAPEPARDLFRREGEYWTIAYEGETFRLRDSKGLTYLGELLRSPAREFLALDLVRVGKQHLGSEFQRVESGLAIAGDSGDAGPLLDSQAKAEYRRRLGDLREELDEAERSNDRANAAKAREEIDFLVSELARATGLRGCDRKAASAVERARQSVSIAIRTTLKKIAENSPALGRHLVATVKTGKFCAYTPDPRSPSSWRV